MRFFMAFCISLFIYLLLIWIYLTQFSHLKTPPKLSDERIIKIDIRNIPFSTPKKVTVVKKAEVKPLVQEKVAPIVKKQIEKKKPKVKPKKVVKKKPIKKKPIKKKVVKKKIVKKKVIKKKVVKKKIVKKKVIKKKVISKKPRPKKVVKPKPKKKVFEDIVEIDNPFLTTPTEVDSFPEPSFTPPPVSKPAKKSDDLASFLGGLSSRPVKKYPSKKIGKLYGGSFHSFTASQKKFIANNLDDIQRITQRTLTRRGYPEGAGQTGQEGTNVVSFNLHPNGNISNLRLKTRIGYRSLDDNTLSLIRVAYKDYPLPSTTTKIIFYVTYSIYGY